MTWMRLIECSLEVYDSGIDGVYSLNGIKLPMSRSISIDVAMVPSVDYMWVNGSN